MDSGEMDLAPTWGADEQEDDQPKDEIINVQAWLSRIGKARTKEQLWRDRAKRCIKIYRDDDVIATTTTYSSQRTLDDTDSSFNILWANVETLLPALFSAVPNPDVRNRYLLTQDKDAESAGQIIERCLSYSLDTYNFARLMKAAIKDYLLTGRSVLRVRLIPEFENQVTHDLDIDGNITQSEDEVMIGQTVRCELVQYDSFVVEPAKRWEDVNWIAFIHMLSKDEFEEYFPDAPLIAAAKEKNKYGTEAQYQVYEIWDKKKKKVYYIGQSEDALKVMDDPFRLAHFWPIPEPLYSIQTNDSLVPIPEYTIYQAQADELNQISYRITDLVKACKFVGVYDSQISGMSDLLTSRDSSFIPVQSNMLKDGGISRVIDSLDTSKISQVLGQLFHQRDQIKGIIYEVTGISDIIRGESNSSETATAQNIKASYAGLRLRDRRDNINKFIVDLLRMKSELICTFFTTDQMQQMSGIQITPQVEAILRSDILRSYKVDIESDSTILADMDQQAQKRAAIVSSITQFLSVTAPMVAQGALPIQTAKALLQYALQPTKISRELEDALELIGQPQAPPQMPVQGLPQNGMPQQGMPQQGMQPPHAMMPHRMPQIPHQQMQPNPGHQPGMAAVGELMNAQSPQ